MTKWERRQRFDFWAAVFATVAWGGIAVSLFAEPPDHRAEQRLMRWGEGIRRQALPQCRIDKVLGLPGERALFIHPKAESAPKPLGKKSLAEWMRGFDWRERMAIIDFDTDVEAKRFADDTFAGLPHHNLKLLRNENVVLFGYYGSIERLQP